MRKIKFAAFGLLLLVVLFASIIIYLLGPKNSETTEKIDFVVASGESSSQVAEKLASQNIIRSSFAFYLYLKMIGGKILPGTYELSSAQSGSDIAEALATGRLKVAKITVIEGWRATQMEDYFVSEKKLTQLKGFATTAEKYEGYLFPDTYEVKVDITISELIEKMRQTFTEKIDKLKVTPETVILASIVEREAAADSERADIAGVYVNRVKQGIKLEADPTVQYAKGAWIILTRDDYRNTISPYNTYLNDGWPPGPIASPGLKSLQAAANPASHDYLYFFHAKGQTFFSKTYTEHVTKVAKYL